MQYVQYAEQEYNLKNVYNLVKSANVWYSYSI